jgi:arsenite methyltransferase
MSTNDITQRVSERYARAAMTGEQMCCPTGYDFEELRSFIPEEVLRVSYGCGTPVGLATVRAGETVLDIGSGGGIDCFDAARRVGSTGRVIGIDMTDAMLDIARRNTPIVTKNLGYSNPNIDFHRGTADDIPVPDDSVDLIISNCVINLAPEKDRVFREMFRVLRPDGRFTVSDIVADQTVPQYLVHDREKWGNCLSGALQVAEYMQGMRTAGFLGIHCEKSQVWQSIDGIHFLSLTLTGYKLDLTPRNSSVCYATLRGPFSSATDELGNRYRRGVPQPIDGQTRELLALPSLQTMFRLSEQPAPIKSGTPEWIAVLPENRPCVWNGDYAVMTGPLIEGSDDDQHSYRRGIPLEICSKTLTVLGNPAYRQQFAMYNRAASGVSGEEVTCQPDGGCC